ncbi:MAG: hypothetical protein FJ276_00675 [Planctomycetes bacterium]|nr:hypothetical protein [Planctomycetota bacterium]
METALVMALRRNRLSYRRCHPRRATFVSDDENHLYRLRTLSARSHIVRNRIDSFQLLVPSGHGKTTTNAFLPSNFDTGTVDRIMIRLSVETKRLHPICRTPGDVTADHLDKVAACAEVDNEAVEWGAFPRRLRENAGGVPYDKRGELASSYLAALHGNPHTWISVAAISV